MSYEQQIDWQAGPEKLAKFLAQLLREGIAFSVTVTENGHAVIHLSGY